MRQFNKDVEKSQTEWRTSHIDTSQMGKQNKKRYPWILPREMWELGLWPGIRSNSSHPLAAYLIKNNVQKHDGVHNLKSSWMLCANLYFPFQQDRFMLTGFLKKYVLQGIATVDAVDLEFAAKRPLDPTTLLGEPIGQRGKYQTSPDVAFVITLKKGGNGLILTESKFTEHSFYECSGRKKEYGNPDPKRCMNFSSLIKDIEQQCYITNWELGKRTNRKYWDYIHFSEKALKTLRRCPAANAGYQLFRQQALAEAIAQNGTYLVVISCVAYDNRNETLIRCLRGTGIKDFTREWGSLFEGKAIFASFTHQQWVNWVRQHNTKGMWHDWLRYIRDRYGY